VNNLQSELDRTKRELEVNQKEKLSLEEELEKANAILRNTKSAFSGDKKKYIEEIESLKNKLKEQAQEVINKDNEIKTLKESLEEHQKRASLSQDKTLEELKTKEEEISRLKNNVKDLQIKVKVTYYINRLKN
jgi:chromosome segregation ATPase